EEVLKKSSGVSFSRESSADRFDRPAKIRFLNLQGLLSVGREKGWLAATLRQEASSVLEQISEEEQYDLVLLEAVSRDQRIDITPRMVELLKER
ncbi:MAG TPA: hypothetical protein VI338_02965, partial [Nitrososphaera sp.]|nr:hypothetical protein [Nitrososphaera sp.]